MLGDLVLGIVFIFTVVCGFRRGLVYELVHTVGWLLSVILAFGWYPIVSEIIRNNTGLYDSMEQSLAHQLSYKAGSSLEDLFPDFPSLLQDTADTAVNSASASIAAGLANLLFSIVAMVLVILGIKAVLFLITSLFSKRNNDGFTGFMDGILGAAFGGVKGLILILIFLALLVPFSSLSPGNPVNQVVTDGTVSRILYDSNPVLLLISALF